MNEFKYFFYIEVVTQKCNVSFPGAPAKIDFCEKLTSHPETFFWKSAFGDLHEPVINHTLENIFRCSTRSKINHLTFYYRQHPTRKYLLFQLFSLTNSTEKTFSSRPTLAPLNGI